jgi:hypothetical protein
VALRIPDVYAGLLRCHQCGKKPWPRCAADSLATWSVQGAGPNRPPIPHGYLRSASLGRGAAEVALGTWVELTAVSMAPAIANPSITRPATRTRTCRSQRRRCSNADVLTIVSTLINATADALTLVHREALRSKCKGCFRDPGTHRCRGPANYSRSNFLLLATTGSVWLTKIRSRSPPETSGRTQRRRRRRKPTSRR